MSLHQPLGAWLKSRRKKLFLTQSQLAELAGCSAVYLKKIEDDSRKPSVAVARKLGDALQLRGRVKDAFVETATEGLAPSPPTNLPTAMNSFIGRAGDVEAVSALVRSQSSGRIISLTGPGGTGKTRLALQVAAGVLQDFADGVFWVDLVSVTRPGFVIPAIVDALGFTEVRVASFEELQDYLHDKEILLILDNFEQVIAAALDVSRLLTSARRLKVMVTSRASLGLRGEQEYHVEPFKVPDTRHRSAVDELLRYDAVQLFVERTRAVKPEFSLTSMYSSAIAEICAYLDGLPLAIELVATRMRFQSPQELLTSLTSRLDVRATNQDRPAHHQTIRATIEWSYLLLSQQNQALLERLAVFRGPCSVKDIIGVCTIAGKELDIAEGLEILTTHHLIRHSLEPDQTSYFSMLETIREYALERLQEHGEFEQLQQQHAVYYLSLVEDTTPKFRSFERAIWIDWIELRQNNVRAALEWVFAHDQIDMGMRFCRALWPFWNERTHIREGGRWMETVLSVPAAHAHPLLGEVLIGASALAHSQAQYQQALDWAEAARVLYEAQQNQQGVADALMRLGTTRRARGEQAEAVAMYKQALQIRQSLNDRPRRAEALHFLGIALYSQNELEMSEACLAASQQLYVELSDQWGVASVLTDVGLCTILQGDFVKAMAVLEQSLALLRRLGRAWDATAVLSYLGFATLFAGQHQRAKQLTRQSLILRREQNDKVGIAYNLEAFAGIATVEGEEATPAVAAEKFARAARLAGAAQSLRRITGSPFLASAQKLYMRYRDSLNGSMGETMYDIYFAEGATMTLDRAIEYALEE